MKYAFDFHGVMQKYPAIFKPMMKDLLTTGNLVSILSGPEKTQILAELDEAGYKRGVHFNHVLSVVDWLHYQQDYRNAQFELWQNEDHSWMTDDITWWSSKSKICQEFGINVLWDDSTRYSDYIVDERPVFFHVK